MRKMRMAAVLAAVSGSLGAGLVTAAPAMATAPTSVTPGTVTLTPATAGSSSTYTIPFTSASALAAAGTITFVAPSGTDFSPCPSNCTTEYPVAVDNQHAATVASAVVSSTGGSPTNNQ
ncbi:MAG TPA: hypothetical protein VFH58_02655, partial [Acidimicrobiales bacterium]|nr:hypothetical protein [Acidimicrobiales bacterium]